MDKQKTKRAAPLVLGRAAAWLARLWNEEHLHILITGVQRFILCAVLARGTVFGGYAPFGLAMASALMARGAGLSAIGGVVCGLMLLGGGMKSGVYIAAALLVLCVMSVCAGLRIVRTAWFAPTIAAFAGAACTFVFLPTGAALDLSALLPFVAVQLLTLGACRVYGAALSPPRDENDWRRPATLLVLVATVLLSLSDLSLFGLLSPARVAALLGSWR